MNDEQISIVVAEPGTEEQFLKIFPQSSQGIEEFRKATDGSGEQLYLLARTQSGAIIGKLYLKFLGVDQGVVKEVVFRCSDIENLEVLPAFRNQGIGSKLILEAEKLSRERGLKNIGLGVAVDNSEARKLYEKLEYRDIGIAPYEISFAWKSQPDLPEEIIHEKVIYLVKEI